MKQLAKDLLVAAFFGLLLPGMILNYGVKVQQHSEQMVEMEEAASLPVKIRNSDGTVEEGEMDTYLVGVVLAEMPAWFEEEALKAQAVVARTYARKAYITGGKHGDGSVCREPNCCQGYRSEEEYLQQGGTEENIEKIENTVRSTSGQVMIYEGELIEATYFSCSGGRTEAAVAVWGADFPYLQAVDSPGEEEAAYYQDEVVLTRKEVAEKLGIAPDEVFVDAVTYTKGGGVDTISMGGSSFSGTEVRQKLGLRSTAFALSVRGEEVVITTKGYGHRVGMSQYGADAMAVGGSTYEEILAHYYPGTELVQLSNE